MSLWLLSFRNGTCTGTLDAAGDPTCLVADATAVPENGFALFATAMVPPDGSAVILNGFSPVPNKALNLYSTTDYEFQFRLLEHGAPVTGVEQFYQQWTSAVYCSASSCPNREAYMVRFPPRKSACNKCSAK